MSCLLSSCQMLIYSSLRGDRLFFYTNSTVHIMASFIICQCCNRLFTVVNTFVIGENVGFVLLYNVPLKLKLSLLQS